MSHIETILIRDRNCDAFGRWKPSSMLEAMQELVA